MIQRLLILGSLDEFVQLIDKANQKGIYTVVCDGYKNSPGKAHAQKYYDIPVDDTETIVKMCREEKIEGIITSFSDFLFECMVKIADMANLPCYVHPEQLKYYRNKSDMKQLLQELEIGSPRFTTLTFDFSDKELEGFQFPVVVKPIDKYGSRGLQVLNSIQEIRDNFFNTCSTSDIKEILVEEYNNGYEFNMMSWLYKGEVHVISIADREKTEIGNNEIPISSRNVYPSRLMHFVYDDAKNILQKIANRLNQTDGALSMQFFWHPDTGIQVCEFAGRFFGYEHELVEYSGGLNIEELLLAYATGNTNELENLLENHDPWFHKHSAALYFHGIEGKRIVDQSKAKILARDEQTEEFILFYEDNSKITHFGKEPYVARYYITASDRETLDRKTIDIFNSISITDETGSEVIYQNQIGTYTFW